MITAFDKAQIGKLTVRGAIRNVPKIKLGMSTLLANTDLKSSSMPPNAILVVNTMKDPLPGKLTRRNNRIFPAAEWQHAVNNQLDYFYLNAVRPHSGILPVEAEAVVFADMAELLACYCCDIVNGQAGQHWWWKVLLKDPPAISSISRTLARVLIDHVQYVPAAVSKLQSWRLAHIVIQLIDKQDALSLCIGLAKEYQLHILAQALTHWICLTDDAGINARQAETILDINNGRDPASVSIDEVSSQATVHMKNTDAVVDVRVHLRSLFIKRIAGNALPASTSVEQILLSGLGNMLDQKPWQAMSTGFQQQLVHVLTGNTMHSEHDRTGVAVGQKTTDYQTDTKITAVPLLKDTSQAEQGDIANTSQIDAKDRVDAVTNIYSDCEVSTNAAAMVDTGSSPTNYQNVVLSEEGVTTDLGGIIYLLNLLNWLDIPDCFEKDWRLSGQTSPWSLLEIIARALLHETIEDFEDDPIWQVLKQLDGRQVNTLPEITLVDKYYLPKQWFDSLNSNRETFRWCADKRRLRIWAASGYILADIPRNNASAFQQADAVLHEYMGKGRAALLAKSEYNHPTIDGRFSDEKFSVGVRQWLSYVMPFIRYQLTLATGLKADNLCAQLLQCRGRVYVTSSHIDLVVPLENISMFARRAGLDRDPGWLAKLGRVVLFHFD